MAQYTKTLKLRIKDKHSKVLCQWAFELNYHQLKLVG